MKYCTREASSGFLFEAISPLFIAERRAPVFCHLLRTQLHLLSHCFGGLLSISTMYLERIPQPASNRSLSVASRECTCTLPGALKLHAVRISHAMSTKRMGMILVIVLVVYANVLKSLDL